MLNIDVVDAMTANIIVDQVAPDGTFWDLAWAEFLYYSAKDVYVYDVGGRKPVLVGHCSFDVPY